MSYGCSCAKTTDQYHGYECEVTGGECLFDPPNSKLCAQMFGEGPDADKYEEVPGLYDKYRNGE